MKPKLRLRSVKLSESQRSRSRFLWKNAPKLPTKNTAGKKRVRQEDADSAYLLERPSGAKTRRGFQDGGPLRNSIPYSAASLTRSGISGSPLLNSSAQAAKKRSKPPGTHTTTAAPASFPITVGAWGIPL